MMLMTELSIWLAPWLLMFVVLLVGTKSIVVQASTGVVRYVATTGSDGAAGTIGAPWLTLSFAVAQCVAGDTLYIRVGTYTGAANVIDSDLSTVSGGTSWSVPITIAAYPGETVTIQPPSQATAIGLQTTTQKYLIFKDLILDGINTTSGGDNQLIYMSGGAHHCRYQNLEVKNSWGFGVHISGNNGAADFNEFLGGSVHNNGRNPSPANQLHGLYILTADNLFEGMDVYANAGCAFHVYDNQGALDVSRNVVRKNIMRGNNTGRFVNPTVYGGNYALVFAWGADNIADKNLVYGNGGGLLAYTNSSNSQFYFNTIVNNEGPAIAFQYHASAPIARNNILSGNGSDIVPLGGTGTPVTSHNLTSNPLFVNVAAENFHLQAGSPAKLAGIAVAGITTDYDGVTRGDPPSIGAYE